MFSKTICLATALIAIYAKGIAQDASPFFEDYFADHLSDPLGREIYGVLVPGKQPAAYRAPIAVPSSSAVLLDSIPAFIWSFGCSSTTAAMAAGYYDNCGYPAIYQGPSNDGIIPMDNSCWGMVTINGETRNQCPLSATMMNLDGRLDKGHLDDYWISTYNYGPDPYLVNGWAQHNPGDCTGDFMGTSQSAVGNSDGTTRFFFLTDGSPLYDFTGSEPMRRDGCHGLCLFYESRGYNVIENYTQLIRGMYGNTTGFTFNQFKEEIDNGRPIIIQVTGHSMLGFGYEEPDIIYLHDTWDFDIHSMCWGGSYAGMNQWGVTIVRLDAVNSPPLADFTGSPALIQVGQNVSFSDLSSYYPASWQWSFEGGSPDYSSEQNPVITYNSPGTFSVSLVATNIYGYDSKVKYAFVTVTDPPIYKTLNLTLFLEGLYNPSTNIMNKASGHGGSYFPSTIADLLNVQLRSSEYPHEVVAEFESVPLDQNGESSLSVPESLDGSYYIIVQHRNSLETWSANPLPFDRQVIDYDFSNEAESAFGNNLKQISDKYCIYGGDANQDGIVNSGDMNLVTNKVSDFTTGYFPEDINGDGTIDSADLIMVDNNASMKVSKIAP
jgi:PKD repeat protein